MQVTGIRLPDAYHFDITAPEGGHDTTQVVVRYARHADAQRLCGQTSTHDNQG